MTLFDNRCFETVEVDAVDQVVTDFVDKHVEKNLGFVSHSYQQNLKPILLSLSGGVDSMVIFEILHKFKIPFRCIHIDYTNRLESGDEAEYLQSFCKTKSIHFKKIRIPFKRDDKDQIAINTKHSPDKCDSRITGTCVMKWEPTRFVWAIMMMTSSKISFATYFNYNRTQIWEKYMKNLGQRKD